MPPEGSPSVLTPTATMTASYASRPPWRGLQTGGVDPQGPCPFKGAQGERADLVVDLGAQPADLALGVARGAQCARTKSWTARVDTPSPCTQASWMTAISAFSAVRRGSRKLGK